MYAEGKTIKEIVKYLNSKGIKTKYGNSFSYNIVQYMLSNRRYIGDYKYANIVIADATPAIVDKGLFERVQQRLKVNKHAPARHKAEDDYLLTTKLFCGKCGAFMVGDAGTSKTGVVHHYYKCVKAKKHLCDKKTVRKEWIEDLAVEKAFELINNEELVNFLVEELFNLQGIANPRLPQLKAQKLDVDKKIENMLQAIEQGVILASTRDRLAELEKQKNELEISILEEEIERPVLSRERIRFGIEQYKQLNIAKKEDRKRLIDCFINAIYLYDDKITFTFNYKDGTKTVLLSEYNFSSNSSYLNGFAPPETT